jgi:3-hydroxyisobutyrate dehydrogenase
MKVAWIGVGVMGGPMARHLLDAGHEVRVYTRTRTKALDLEAGGAVWAGSPADAARGAEVVGTMVGFPSDVEEVVLGPEGVLAGMEGGGLLIDFTTSSPALARRVAEAAAARGIGALDAPVSGGDVGARNATLSIMVGGAREDFDRALPLLEKLGRTVVYQGPAGSGQHTKMVNQVLIATNMIGVCEALLYARRAGLDPHTVLKSVGGGAASSWALANLAPRILRDDLEPGFYVEHFIKDMGIALEESRRLGLQLPGLELAHRLYTRLAAMGGARQGTQALIRALESLTEEREAR